MMYNYLWKTILLMFGMKHTSLGIGMILLESELLNKFNW